MVADFSLWVLAMLLNRSAHFMGLHCKWVGGIRPMCPSNPIYNFECVLTLFWFSEEICNFRRIEIVSMWPSMAIDTMKMISWQSEIYQMIFCWLLSLPLYESVLSTMKNTMNEQTLFEQTIWQNGKNTGRKANKQCTHTITGIMIPFANANSYTGFVDPPNLIWKRK